MKKRNKKNPKGTKKVSVKDLPPKPKGGDSVKGGKTVYDWIRD